MIIVFFDGTEVSSPTNWPDLTTTIRRGTDLDGFLITQDANFVWITTAYDYLYDKFWNEYFCSEVEVEIIEQCEGGEVREIYNGIIKVADLVFNDHECSVQCMVEDRSFNAYIYNNRNQEVSPTQNGTKNGVEIDPPPIWELDAFNPANPANPPNYRNRGYRVYDLLEHAITVITDGKVGFVSDFLWNQSEELFLTTGLALSVPETVPTFVYSFEKLYSELNKQFNLAFFIEENLYNLPTLRIEPKEYFYSTEPGFTFEDLRDLKISVDKNKLYGTVLLGSTVLDGGEAYLNFNENTPFYGFNEVKFYPRGQCNTAVELNLVNDYVISHSVIEDCIMNAADSFDQNLIFVTCENLNVSTNQAVMKRFALGTAPPYLYNMNLNNYNKAQRHFGFLQGNLLDAFNVSSNNFRAEKATDEIFAVGASGTETPLNYVSGTGWVFRYCLTFPICPAFAFPDESTAGNYDLGGNYDNTTYVYTIPTDGQYTFNVRVFMDILNAVSITDAACYIVLKQYDNTVTTLIDSQQTGTVMPLVTGGSEAAVGSAVFDCVAGDKIFASVDFVVEATNPPSGQNLYRFRVRGTSYFESTSDNVIVAAADINYKIIKYEFTLPVSPTDFRSILANPSGLQTFTKWNEIQQEFISRRAWIDEIRYNRGLATIRLVTNYAITEDAAN